jgi:hypothetical protein
MLPNFDFIETLEKNRQSFMGALCTLCFNPSARASLTLR